MTIPTIDIRDGQQRLYLETVLAAATGINNDLAELGIELTPDAKRAVLQRTKTLFWEASRGTGVEIAASLIEAGFNVDTAVSQPD